VTTGSALVLLLLFALPFISIPAQGLLDSAAAALF
jgi:hypothetical protein